MKKRSYTEQQLIEAIKASTSIRQVLKLLGLKPAGGNYKTIHANIQKLNLDISHFTGQSWNKGKTLPARTDLNDYLSNKKPIQSNKLKKRLLKEQIFKPVCSMCNKTKWMKQAIPLELDHLDGHTYNNSLSNLRLLCPNCHALTPNYRGKNKGNYSNS